MKKFLMLVLAFVLILSIPVSANEDAKKDGIFSYLVDGNTVTVVGVEDVQAEVKIPETFDGKAVTKIGKGVFSSTEKIEKVYIPDSVTEIGSMCFAYSASIKSVRLSRKITKIEEGLFYQCKNLIGVTIPDGVTQIGSKAFAQCENMTSVAVPKSVTFIEDDAFNNSDKIIIYCAQDESAPVYNWALARNIQCEDLIRVYVNDVEVDFDQSPITDKKAFRTLVPLRSVLEQMGAVIEWYDDMEYAGISINGNRILLKPVIIGTNVDSRGMDPYNGLDPFMRVNDKTVFISSSPVEYNGRVLLPIRDVVEAIGGRVGWNEVEKRVDIIYITD